MSASPPREIELEIPGLTLAARHHACAGGLPVLGLHGWLDNAATFDSLAPLLPEVDLVSLDLAGHGLSAHRPEAACYDFVHWIPDVFAAADELGWQRFTLLGHSLGAAIALCAAGTMPSRVQAVIAIDGLGPLASPAATAPERLEAAIEERKKLLTKASSHYPSPAEMARKLCIAIDGLTEEGAALLVARGAHEIDGRWFWRHDPRLRGASLSRLTEEQVAAFMGRVGSPTLLIRAKGGWPVPEAALARRRGYLKSARYLELVGPHHLHLSNPTAVAEETRRFLSESVG